MADEKKSSAQKAVEKDAEKVAESGNETVQERVDEHEEQGFTGTEADTTPNEHYTVDGVTSGKPVPEAAEDPVAARRDALNPDLR